MLVVEAVETEKIRTSAACIKFDKPVSYVASF